MAYEPAELKLPAWLLTLLDALIRFRFPVAPGWTFGNTRAGVMFVAAMVGIWAAAFYSGNNLLYLCGAVMTALMLAAVSQAAWLLKSFPALQAALPMLEAGRVTALRQPLAVRNPGAFNASAIVEISCWYAGGGFALIGHCSNQQICLQGRLQPERRGLFRIPRLQLRTTAPIGLFVLTCIRRDPFELIVLPAVAPWGSALAGLSDAGVRLDGGRAGEGDEWRDLRAYAPGDAPARVHWRKADGDIRNWVVKRFGSVAQSSKHQLLRVDLRVPTGMDEAAFEQMLGRACGWIQQQEHRAAGLILGQAEFDFTQPGKYMQALKALAAVEPESGPPAGQGGLLLSVNRPGPGNGRC